MQCALALHRFRVGGHDAEVSRQYPRAGRSQSIVHGVGSEIDLSWPGHDAMEGATEGAMEDMDPFEAPVDSPLMF